MSIPQTPTFIQTAQRLNAILAEHSAKLSGQSLADGLIDSKSRIRQSEKATREFQKALKDKANLKDVNKQWRDFRKKQDAIKKTADKANKLAENLKKTTDKISTSFKNLVTKTEKIGKIANSAKQAIEKLNNLLNKTIFKKVLPAKAGIILSSLAQLATAGIIVFSAKNSEEIQGIDLEKERIVQTELNTQIRLIEQNFNATKRLQKEVDANSEAINVINALAGETRRYVFSVESKLQLALQQLSFRSNAQIQAIRDSLMQIVRQTTINQRQLFNNFQNLKQRVDFLNSRGLDAQLLNRIQTVETRTINTQTIVKAVEARQTQTNTRVASVENRQAQTTAKVIALEARVNQQLNNPNLQNQLLESLKNRLNNLSTEIIDINDQVKQIETNLPEKITKVAKLVVERLVNGRIEQLNKDLSVRIDKKIDKDKLLTEIQLQGGGIVRVLEPYIKPVIAQQTAGLSASVPTLTSGIQAIANDLNRLKLDVNRLKVREDKVPNQSPIDLSPILRRLDQVDARIALVPALVLAPLGRNLDQLKRGIPTVDQIGSAAAAANCRTLQPGGCSRKALDDLGNSIKGNQNQNANNLLNAINAGQNAAQLALLNRIDGKLGPQLPGGISSFLEKFLKRLNKLAEWLHLDRALNILIWWQTLHNATMLSNNVVQTLASSMDNVLNFLQIKNLDGSTISISEIVGKAYTDMMKSALGEETYNNVNKLFNSANRIYQAATNIVNAIQNINQAILGALEIIGASVARIANALKASGTVLENALQFMNPSPNFDNKLFTFLERMDQNASTIEQVTQAPLEVREAVDDLKQQKRDILEATKDGENALKGLGIIESENEKKKSLEGKAASSGKELAEVDLLDAEEVA